MPRPATVHSLTYRGCRITPRTFQIRGSLEWTLDIVIAYRSRRRAFSGPERFPTEQEAIQGCHAFGRRIIDGRVPHRSMDDLR